jgi:hypothetical protein
MNSNTPARASATFGDWLDATIPSATGRLQEVWSFGDFSISTRHIRQLASGFNFG